MVILSQLNFTHKYRTKPLFMRVHSVIKAKQNHLEKGGFLVGAGGFGPPKSVTTDLQSAPFDRSGTLPYSLDRRARRLEPVDGLEPPTC